MIFVAHYCVMLSALMYDNSLLSIVAATMHRYKSEFEVVWIHAPNKPTTKYNVSFTELP